MGQFIVWLIVGGLLVCVAIDIARPDLARSIEFVGQELTLIIVFGLVFIGMAYLLWGVIGTYLKDPAERSEMQSAFKKSPVKSILQTLLALSVTAFFGALLLSALHILPQKSMMFIWFPASWIVIWVLQAVLPDKKD